MDSFGAQVSETAAAGGLPCSSACIRISGKLVPVGYGIKKLQIVMVIEDAKVSLDDITDKILENVAADYAQSVDVVFFNKL